MVAGAGVVLSLVPTRGPGVACFSAGNFVLSPTKCPFPHPSTCSYNTNPNSPLTKDKMKPTICAIEVNRKENNI
jgi:hypothetical protein